MKLRCKIYKTNLDKILSGEKNIEYRQVESIIFDCEGEQYEYTVERIKVLSDNKPSRETMDKLKAMHPDVKWEEDLSTLVIYLGEKKITKQKT